METIDTIEYRGYSINVHPDFHPMNPWEDWDSEPPILVWMAGRGGGFIKEYGVDDSLPLLTNDEVRQYLPGILSAMGYSADWLGLMQFARDYYPGTEHDLVDVVRDRYDEYVTGMSPEDRFEAIAETYDWKGFTAVQGSIHGHCQGDYGMALCVITKEWADKVGAPENTHRDQAENAIQLFEDFAFGNVYGVTITDPDSLEIDDGACWGFYGTDNERSGLLPEAQGMIDHDIPIRKERLQIESRARAEASEVAAVFNAQSDGPTLEVKRSTPVEIVDGDALVNVQMRILGL